MQIILARTNRLTNIGRSLNTFFAQSSPWTNTVGLARSLMALGACGTLLSNNADVLFHKLAGGTDPCTSVAAHVSMFCIFPHADRDVLRLVSAALLLVVASGWRPRITGLLHWWIAFSIFGSTSLSDGGDQVSETLTLLLIPLTLSDLRKWHWQQSPSYGQVGTLQILIGISTVMALKFQVCMIYFHAFIGKSAVREWVDGTAMYYWLTSNYMGLPHYLAPALAPILKSPFVTLVTWSSMILELSLAAAILMPWRARKLLLILSLIFHGMIAIMIGIPSFSLAVFGALLIYLPNCGMSLKETFRIDSFRIKRNSSLQMVDT